MTMVVSALFLVWVAAFVPTVLYLVGLAPEKKRGFIDPRNLEDVVFLIIGVCLFSPFGMLMSFLNSRTQHVRWRGTMKVGWRKVCEFVRTAKSRNVKSEKNSLYRIGR